MLCGISLVVGIILKSDTGDVLVIPVITAAALFGITTIYAVRRAENERLKKRRILISGLIIISFLTGIIRVSDVSAALDSYLTNAFDPLGIRRSIYLSHVRSSFISERSSP